MDEFILSSSCAFRFAQAWKSLSVNAKESELSFSDFPAYNGVGRSNKSRDDNALPQIRGQPAPRQIPA